MAIPSGSGSEIVYRTCINALSDTETTFRWDRTMATTGTSTYTVPTNFLITVLSVVITNIESTARTFDLKWTDGSLTVNLVRTKDLPSLSTFVFNDKLVLVGGDKLAIALGSTGNVDCLCSYIVQDHT